VHVDEDWVARTTGDLRCRPLVAWQAGLLDALPATVDPAIVGVAGGLGRNGWGAGILMRDVGRWLVPESDAPITLEEHRRFLDRMAEVAACFWGWHDDIGLTPLTTRYAWFGFVVVETETSRPRPDVVPLVARDGWTRFAERAPADIVKAVIELRHDPTALVDAITTTPSTLLHGDWKLSNVGTHPDGRTILLDWAAPGQGPACSDLTWYLALNRARLPEPKEAAIDAYRASLERHGVSTASWWNAQLELCLLGALLLFGWEKALGDEDELGWWVEAARPGVARL
jgi:hypothetical protein